MYMHNLLLNWCKTKITLLIVFVAISSLVNAKVSEIPEDLQQFLETFTSAVVSHNRDAVMNLLDVDYKKEQHDAFLKGNTQQFLDKFFCGYDPTDGETYECMKFKEVSKLELSNVIPDIELYIVMFYVTDSDSTVEVTWIVSAKPDANGVIQYGMIGTYG